MWLSFKQGVKQDDSYLWKIDTQGGNKVQNGYF